ncbi:MAG: hypothetical protein HZA20_01415 [Nitrospirae bacterium]|nr:hypothetical protein [Nitrospirota bacterium]
MPDFLRKNLRRQIIAILAAIVGALVFAGTLVSSHYQTKAMREQFAVSGDNMAATIYGSLEFAMSIGKGSAVRDNLARLRRQVQNVEVLICDAKSRIFFATDAVRVGDNAASAIENEPARSALRQALAGGIAPSGAFEESLADTRRIVKIYPILNEDSCRQCHSASGKVIGAMVVKMDVTREMESITLQERWNFFWGIIGMVMIVGITYLVMDSLITKPLRLLTAGMKELPERIAAGENPALSATHPDMPGRIDEMGDLLRTFNMMGNALHEKNEEIRKANLNLAVANKELEAFAYSVSHDLRAPLRNIDGFSKIILEEYESRLDDSGRHYLARIRYGTHRMSVLIDDMLKFSRVSRTELDVRQVSCNELVNDVLRDFVEEIKARNVSLSVRELPDVICDYSMMRLVLSNLVANAIKYSRKTENPKIVIGYDEERGAVFVKDNGIGFDMRYHDKIFQVFQRLHLPEEYDGTGIGLAIAKKAVDRHHGSIWAEAAPGEGASFFVSLPFADK